MGYPWVLNESDSPYLPLGQGGCKTRSSSITRAYLDLRPCAERTGTTWSRSNIGFGTALEGGHLNIPLLRSACLNGGVHTN